jgi:hypothetical protein
MWRARPAKDVHRFVKQCCNAFARTGRCFERRSRPISNRLDEAVDRFEKSRSFEPKAA